MSLTCCGYPALRVISIVEFNVINIYRQVMLRVVRKTDVGTPCEIAWSARSDKIMLVRNLYPKHHKFPELLSTRQYTATQLEQSIYLYFVATYAHGFVPPRRCAGSSCYPINSPACPLEVYYRFPHACGVGMVFRKNNLSIRSHNLNRIDRTVVLPFSRRRYCRLWPMRRHRASCDIHYCDAVRGTALPRTAEAKVRNNQVAHIQLLLRT